jgi:alpha-amylase
VLAASVAGWPSPWTHARRIALLLAVLLAATAHTLAGTVTPAQADSEVFYQIFIRSFRDANGDRIGDLRGLESQLDYLQRLGVTSVLLTPLQPSPFYHNYFASSFEGIDPAFGTLADFHSLVRAMHARHLRIYLDQEIQYVTGEHQWLRDSQGNPASRFSHYILYNAAGNRDPESAFLGLHTLASYDGREIFAASVNLRDPKVVAYFQKLFTSWVDPHGDGSLRDGVDGFRIDHMMDDLDGKGKITGLFAGFWRPVFAAVRAVDPAVRIVAEQYDWGYGDDCLNRGGVDAVFAFPLRNALVSFDKAKILEAIRETARRTPAGKTQLTFVENHDVERFASLVGASPAKEKIGAAFTLLLQGTPLIYYGQEIGMRGAQSSAFHTDANDIGVREAFRWTSDLEASGSAIWYVGDHPWWTNRFNRSGDGVSVEEETGKPESLLNFYRRLLGIRARRAELRTGSQTILCAQAPSVVCFVRGLGNARSLIAINLAADPVTVELSAEDIAAAGMNESWRDLLDHGRKVEARKISLAGFGVSVLGSPSVSVP